VTFALHPLLLLHITFDLLHICVWCNKGISKIDIKQVIRMACFTLGFVMGSYTMLQWKKFLMILEEHTSRLSG
jgi:hypothetical protein